MPKLAMPARDTPNAAESIAGELRGQIITDLADGDHIGSEDQLVNRFHVSRPTIRQAMRVLEAEGLVRVRRGNSGGFFAGTPSVDVLSRSASAYLRRRGAHLGHLVASAELIGPEIAGLAAANADSDARNALLTFAEQTWSDDAETTIDTAVVASIEITHRMGALCGNPSLALFADVLGHLVLDLQREVIETTDPQQLDAYARGLRTGHLELAHAIADGDVPAARAAQLRLNAVA
jgi:DNA-binding FadR family transcriptional regulator